MFRSFKSVYKSAVASVRPIWKTSITHPTAVVHLGLDCIVVSNIYIYLYIYISDGGNTFDRILRTKAHILARVQLLGHL